MKLKIRLVGFVRSYFGTNAQLHQMPKLIFKSITTTTYDVRGHTKKTMLAPMHMQLVATLPLANLIKLCVGNFDGLFSPDMMTDNNNNICHIKQSH